MQTTAETPHARTLQIRNSRKRPVIPFDIPKGTEVLNWRVEHGTLLIELVSPANTIVEIDTQEDS